MPVNFPPTPVSQPYLVRIYDPHIVGGPTEGITADRLKVGGEALTRFYSPGNPYESGLIYIDQNGQGRTPVLSDARRSGDGLSAGCCAGGPGSPRASGPARIARSVTYFEASRR